MRSTRMLNLAGGAALATLLLGGAAELPPDAAGAPHYDAQGRLILPADYREWTFLSSGLDMSYSDKAPMGGEHMFNNVFVPRAAYETFHRTGHWPDKTVLVLENRGGATNRSILKHGQVQTTEVMGLEVHVKDKARFKGGWGFFSFGGAGPAEQIRHSAACYSCHEAHGAVDTTFVQFYPTLLTTATRLKTLAAGYLAEAGGK